MNGSSHTADREDLDVLDATFTCPDLTTFVRVVNGRLERLRGSALGFRNLTNHIARSSIPAADTMSRFAANLQAPRRAHTPVLMTSGIFSRGPGSQNLDFDRWRPTGTTTLAAWVRGVMGGADTPHPDRLSKSQLTRKVSDWARIGHELEASTSPSTHNPLWGSI